MIRREFSDVVKRGDEISKEIFEDMQRIVPPIYIKQDEINYGFQMGEPVQHVESIHEIRLPQYMTFVNRNGHYYYEGLNFAGYIDSRKMELPPREEQEEKFSEPQMG